MALSLDYATLVVTVPQADLTVVSGGYELDVNDFKVWINDIEDSEAHAPFLPIIDHNTTYTLSGLEYARKIEIVNGYTITFQDTGSPYRVFLKGGNNNILDVTNLNNVSVAPSNSAGLINIREVQYGAFDDGVSIDVVNGVAGTNYPTGSQLRAVNNLADAQAIAAANGFTNLYIKDDLTIGATEDIGGYNLIGNGATANTQNTTVTITAGAGTSGALHRDSKVTGYQGGESRYINCAIDTLDNAHCQYLNCVLKDGTAAGYTIRQSAGPGASHTTHLFNCHSDEGTAIIDRNGGKITMHIIDFFGQLKFVNSTNAAVGKVLVYMIGGTIEIDPSCTEGHFEIYGNYELIHTQTGNEEVHQHTTGFEIIASEVWAQGKALTVGKFLALK